MKTKQKYLIIAGIVAAAVIAMYFVGTALTGQYAATGKYDELANCLTDKGVVMYGSKYCPHCKAQKEMFGDSFQYVTYIECTEQTQLCQERGINAVPAWEIGGSLYFGVKSLSELASMAGCSLS